MKTKLILASGSIWRKRLMKKHGLQCRIFVTDFKEKKRELKPSKLVLYNATGKARAACEHVQAGIVIGVDTIGVLDGRILSKPRDISDALKMLKSLSGRRHTVMTAVCVIDSATGKKLSAVVRTGITFRKLAESEIAAYLASGQWKGKAGAYAIQARAKGFVKSIRGDITNVVGLPMEKLKKMLKKIATARP